MLEGRQLLEPLIIVAEGGEHRLQSLSQAVCAMVVPRQVYGHRHMGLLVRKPDLGSVLASDYP
jgi:hypothetical protein